MDEGEAVATRVVANMDPPVAIAGLSQCIRVFDPGIFEPTASTDDGLGRLRVRSAGSLECEVGGYVVHARTAEAWDAIVALLVALADDRPDAFHALMHGCRRLSNSTPEADGLDSLMLEPEQWLHDVARDRDRRRSRDGYLTASDARAFLQMARQPRSRESSPINTVAAACFRALDDAMGSAGVAAQPAGPAAESPSAPAVSASIEVVADLLAEAGLASARLGALPDPGSAGAAHVTPMEPLMEHVHDVDPLAYFARNRELAFLANALVAGCSVHARPFTTEEAWNAAIGICNVGLEVWPSRWPDATADAARAADIATTLPDAFLVDHDLVTAFDAGWRLLHEDVSMFAAGRLIAMLADLRSVDAVSQRDLDRLRRALERNHDASTPWQARDALDVLATFDMPTWASLLGLLSECPVLPAALTALLHGHAGSVSASAFAWFTTRTQIRRVHEFIERVPDLLRG
jgi:hypothetical protein